MALVPLWVLPTVVNRKDRDQLLRQALAHKLIWLALRAPKLLLLCHLLQTGTVVSSSLYASLQDGMPVARMEVRALSVPNV